MITILKSFALQIFMSILGIVTIYSLGFHIYNNRADLILDFFGDPLISIVDGGEYLEEKIKDLKAKQVKDSLNLREVIIQEIKK